MRFTKSTVAALTLPEGKSEHLFWDFELPCFGIRLRARANGTTSKTWVIQYRIGRRQHRESFDIRKVELDAARRVARAIFARVELGQNPAAKAQVDGLTLAQAAARYLEVKRDVLRPNTLAQVGLHLSRHWKPLRNRALGDIARVDVSARLQELVAVHGRTAATRARTNLSSLYAWAMAEGLVDGNPVLASSNPGRDLRARDRVLSDDELRAIWHACHGVFGQIVRLLALTGARRSEIGDLKWDEVNLDSGLLTVSGERTKNKSELRLLLPSLALEILRSVPRRGDFVFGVRSGFVSWSQAKRALDARIAAAEGRPIAAWHLHDLRRTYRTNLGRLGTPPHLAELAINHVQRGLLAVYDRHRYQREIGQALTLWAEYVQALIEGRAAIVVSLRTA